MTQRTPGIDQEGVTLDTHFHPSAPATKAIFANATTASPAKPFLRPRCGSAGEIVEVTSNPALVKCEDCKKEI